MPRVVLTTLNARYSHASLGLRYLAANMGDLAGDTQILEFVVAQRPADVLERLLMAQPQIVGFGVYIWNVDESTRLVAMLKAVRPDITIIVGGPEVSHEPDAQPIVAAADYLITGPGDLSFPRLARALLGGQRPPQKQIAGETPDLGHLELPYHLYTDEDIRHRLIYVEASRGCPFKCEFCLSALDKTAWPFPLPALLAALDALHRRGARTFKFVDRTFNLNIKTSLAILDFFLERLDERLFLHFEVIPDHLPEALKTAIARFQPGQLQLEVGIQTFNPAVQANISRRQNNAASTANLHWLRNHSHAHLHVDLIAGLPGEDWNSFAAGFDQLAALAPHEIQVGILKRLRGTPISRHEHRFGLVFNPFPPYNILASDQLDYFALQRLGRFARYWEMVANSGRFRNTVPLLLGDKPFDRFMALSDWIFGQVGATHQIALERLTTLLYQWLADNGCRKASAHQALLADFQACGTRNPPRALKALLDHSIR